MNVELHTTDNIVVDGVQVGDETTADVVHEVIIEPPQIPSPVADLTTAYRQTTALSQAGATDQIRYTAKRAAEMLSRLLRDLETHRRIVGDPVR